MSKRIMITIPDDIYVGLERASEESMRPIATEAIYRIKLGLSSDGESKISTLAPNYKKFEKELDDFADNKPMSWGKVGEYDDLIERIESAYDVGNGELDYEERGQLSKDIKEAGLVWNSYKRTLDKVVDGKFVTIHKFS